LLTLPLINLVGFDVIRLTPIETKTPDMK
jgi:hypothetical protein